MDRCAQLLVTNENSRVPINGAIAYKLGPMMGQHDKFDIFLSFLLKMTKNIKFVITRFVFKLKMHQNQFSGPRWGSLPRSPRPPSRLGRGYPLAIPLPLELSSRAPLNTKSWLRQCHWRPVFRSKNAKQLPYDSGAVGLCCLASSCPVSNPAASLSRGFV